MFSDDPDCRHTLVRADDAPARSPSPPAEDATDLTLSMSPVLGGHLIEVRARGDVDMLTAGCLGRALSHAAGLLRPPGTDPPEPPGSWCPEVVCDLSDVDFFGAKGVRALLDAASEARDHGVVLSLVAGHRVHRVLTLTGTDGALPLSTPHRGDRR